MRHRHAVLAGWTLATCSAIVAWTTAARGAAPTPSHTSADVISVDPQTRTMVIKNAAGTQQTVELDDQVAGFEGIQAGDRVILTLRNEPHHARVSSIVKSSEGTRGKVVPAPRPPAVVTPAAPGSLTAESAFAERVQALAQQASRVDGLWGEFRSACSAKPTSSYEGGREWFGLWDNMVRADLSGGFCRDLFNQIVAGGTTITKGMAAAEDAAAKTLLPGTIREIRRQYTMDWSGWKQTPPDRLEP